MPAELGFFLIGSVAAGAVSGASAYFGWKNVQQADVLANAIPMSRLEHNVGRCVAVRGKPGVLYQGNDPIRRTRLWERRVREVYVKKTTQRAHDRGSWRTESTSEVCEDFSLTADGVTLVVRNRATEVHGTESATESEGSSLFSMGGERRTRIEWLPASLPSVTACGRLVRDGRGYSIVADGSLGLLLSAHDPQAQAWREKTKGWLGIVVAPVFWAGASFVLWRAFMR